MRKRSLLISEADRDVRRLLTVLVEGHAVVVIDNVERDLQSDALCTVLTEETFTDRPVPPLSEDAKTSMPQRTPDEEARAAVISCSRTSASEASPLAVAGWM